MKIAQKHKIAVGLLFLGLTLPLWAGDYPSWWTNRSVVATEGPVTNDYAPVNQGQIKWIATNAYLELEDNLPGGAGSNVLVLVQSFTLINNYIPLNIGQLKYVATPFYDRLIEEGITNAYPWTTNSTDDADYSVANIGQVKYVFSFDPGMDSDGDGLSDLRETNTGIYVDPDDTGTDPNEPDSDDDGVDDGDEVTNRTNPNDDDTTPPTITVSTPTDNYTKIWIP